MNRRDFLSASATLAVLPTVSAFASDAIHVEYSRAAYDAALAAGKPFMLDFYASW